MGDDYVIRMPMKVDGDALVFPVELEGKIYDNLDEIALMTGTPGDVAGMCTNRSNQPWILTATS
ncbi:MAG: hypothetical protein ABEJ69_02740 [Candidatus Nanohaloarchaea archaeon]